MSNSPYAHETAPAGSLFCPRCGARLSEPQRPADVHVPISQEAESVGEASINIRASFATPATCLPKLAAPTGYAFRRSFEALQPDGLSSCTWTNDSASGASSRISTIRQLARSVVERGTMTLQLFPNGAMQGVQQTGLLGMSVNFSGQWAFDPYQSLLKLQGIVAGYTPFVLGISIQGLQGDAYRGFGSDGQQYILRKL